MISWKDDVFGLLRFPSQLILAFLGFDEDELADGYSEEGNLLDDEDSLDDEELLLDEEELLNMDNFDDNEE